jgi:hypothetical protein
MWSGVESVGKSQHKEISVFHDTKFKPVRGSYLENLTSLETLTSSIDIAMGQGEERLSGSDWRAVGRVGCGGYRRREAIAITI